MIYERPSGPSVRGALILIKLKARRVYRSRVKKVGVFNVSSAFYFVRRVLTCLLCIPRVLVMLQRVLVKYAFVFLTYQFSDRNKFVAVSNGDFIIYKLCSQFFLCPRNIFIF